MGGKESCMSSYSAEFKSVILSKLLGPNPPSIIALSQNSGVSKGTLYAWVKQVKSNKIVDIPKRVKRVQNWTKQERFKALLDTANMGEEQLNAYCRKNGIFPAQLEDWKIELSESLSNKDAYEKESKIKNLESELQSIKQELSRKDKALAEASAILFLKKKAQDLWPAQEEEK